MMSNVFTVSREDKTYIAAEVAEEQWDAEAVRDAIKSWVSRDDTGGVKVRRGGATTNISAGEGLEYKISDNGMVLYVMSDSGTVLTTVAPGRELTFRRAKKAGEWVAAGIGGEDCDSMTDGGVNTITVHGERVTIPEGFQPTDDAVDSQVECLNCGRTCTVGVSYGEQAGDHACYADVPSGEDAGFPVGGF